MNKFKKELITAIIINSIAVIIYTIINNIHIAYFIGIIAEYIHEEINNK